MSVSVASGVSYVIPADEIRINLEGADDSDLLPGVASYFYRSTGNGNIVGWAVVANNSGSLSMDVLLKNGDIPIETDIISIDNPPTLTNEQLSLSFNTVNWKRQIKVGDIIGVNIKDCAGISSAVISLKVERF